MKANIGTTERVTRIVIGVAGIVAGIYFESWWGLLGVHPLGTGLTGVCGLYAMLGLTRSGEQQ